jgi:hypothetical protein
MKLITKIFLFLGISLFLVGCDEIQTNKQITSIEIDQSTLSESYDVESFDLSTIKLIVNYSDDTSITMNLSEDLLSSEDNLLLSSTGSHVITVTYQGFTTTITISLINSISVFQQIYNLGVSSELIIDITY